MKVDFRDFWVIKRICREKIGPQKAGGGEEANS
jgi:hypothetical protein